MGPDMNGAVLDVEKAREICDFLADSLMGELSDFHVAQFHTNPRKNFPGIMENILHGFDPGFDILRFVDVSEVALDDRLGGRTLWEWAKNLSKIDKSRNYEEACAKFKAEFFNRYSKVK